MLIMAYNSQHTLIAYITILLCSAIVLALPEPIRERTPPPSWPVTSFHTTSYRPPVLETVFSGDVAAGYVLLAPFGFPPSQNAPVIMRKSGELVWHGVAELAPNAYLGFEQQLLDGVPVLTYWNGSLAAPEFQRGYGSINILDNHYKNVYTVSLADESFVTLDNSSYPSYIDIHEDSLTSRGSIIVTATNITQADLTSVGGPADGWIIDSLLYEVDVKTNVILFKWSSYAHIKDIPFSGSRYPLNGTGTSQSNPWNYFVLNSAQEFGDKYIISGRYYCSIYMVDRQGDVEWQLDGQHGHSFSLADNTSFCYQHHVRAEYSTGPSAKPETMLLHMHNNNNADVPSPVRQSTTGLLISINLHTRVATTVRSLSNASAPIYSTFMGSYQAFPSGHVCLGHGAIPTIEEYNASGDPIWSAKFGEPGSTISYRAFLSDSWTGTPAEAPVGYACQTTANTTAVYMSWNGATEYTSWAVYDRSPKVQAHKPLAVVNREGFETRVEIPRVARVQVEARGYQGSGVSSNIVPVQDSC